MEQKKAEQIKSLVSQLNEAILQAKQMGLSCSVECGDFQVVPIMIKVSKVSVLVDTHPTLTIGRATH